MKNRSSNIIIAMAFLCVVSCVQACDAEKQPGPIDPVQLAVRTGYCGFVGMSLTVTATLYARYLHRGHQDGSTRNIVFLATIECFHRAQDCESMEACIIASEEQMLVCGDDISGERCVDETKVNCRTGEKSECGQAGLECVESFEGATCGLGPCVPGTDEPYCDKDLLVVCDPFEYAWMATDCRYDTGHYEYSEGDRKVVALGAGGTCGTGLDGVPACVGTGETCDPQETRPVCEDDVIITCRHGKVSRYRCETFLPDAVCEVDQDEEPYCTVAHKECTPRMDESCKNGVISFCNLGKYDQVDCRFHGYGRCECSTVMDQVACFCAD